MKRWSLLGERTKYDDKTENLANTVKLSTGNHHDEKLRIVFPPSTSEEVIFHSRQKSTVTKPYSTVDILAER